jgi:flagellar biosynthetic protein FliR
VIELAVLERFGLLLVRPGMLIALAPALGGAHLPVPVKVGLTVLVAIGLLPSVSVPTDLPELTLGVVVGREAIIGMSLGFALRALIAGAEFAGHLSGQQIGFSYGATIDPQSGVRNNMLATLYGSLATLGFLAINGHHAVLRALAQSYSALPIGGGSLDASVVSSVRDILALVFVVAVRLAAPIIIVLLVVEVMVGLISRASPAMNYMVIGYPLRLIVGMTLLAALVPVIPAVTNSLVESVLMTGAQMARAFR